MGTPAAVHRIGFKSKSLLARLSLRARLLLGLILVATVGLVVADTVVYGQIDSYLNAQVDNELQTGASAVVAALGHRGDLSGGLPLNTAAEVATSNGSIVLTNPTNFHLAISTPQLNSIANSAPTGKAALFSTTGSNNGAVAPYRVLPEAVTVTTSFFGPSSQAVAFIAIPLGPLDGTLHQLIVVELAVSAGVLVLLALLGYAVVRIGMRPLAQIEETAEAIAGGDLGRRVDRDDPTTEIGRLGASLNAMLGQIEHAFTEQQASEDRLRQFLADASHELRTPVTSIRGYAELFRRGAADRPADLAQSMRRIEEEATRMGGLVEDLLLLARLDRGRPLELHPVDLSAVAIDAAADAAIMSPERSITVETEPTLVNGDEQRLHQVVMNLIHNALRHTPSSTAIMVRVSANGKAELSVHDDGPGIPAQHVGRIFERFYRGDPSRTRESGGSGLGLAIVASIAEAHGGKARVESPEGAGSTFIVELPLLSEDSPSPGDQDEPKTFSHADDNRFVGNGSREQRSPSGNGVVEPADQASTDPCP